MRCPKCDKKVKTIDSRGGKERVRRRKRCFHCNYRFTTVELIRPSADLSEAIQKKAERFFFKGKKVESTSEIMALKELSAFGCILLNDYLDGKLEAEKCP